MTGRQTYVIIVFGLLLLIIFRLFQGIGGAILTPIVLPMGIELLGKENTSRITAIMGTFSALAAAGGPVIVV